LQLCITLAIWTDIAAILTFSGKGIPEEINKAGSFQTRFAGGERQPSLDGPPDDVGRSVAKSRDTIGIYEEAVGRKSSFDQLDSHNIIRRDDNRRPHVRLCASVTKDSPLFAASAECSLLPPLSADRRDDFALSKTLERGRVLVRPAAMKRRP